MNAATIGESRLRDLNQNRSESSNFEFDEAIKKNKLHRYRSKDHEGSWKRYRNKNRMRNLPNHS